MFLPREHLLVLLAVSLPGCVTQPQPQDTATPAPTGTSVSTTWFPRDLLYPHPFADPRAPSLGTRYQIHVRGRENDRIENSFGAEGSFYRVIRKDKGDAFEIAFDAAVFSRFDYEEALDLDASDFVVGFPLVYRSGRLAVKVHPWHLTSHLGDEFAEREGETRIDYARNAVALGVAYDIGESWRAYGEAGYGFNIGSLNERGRWMAGVEWVDDIFGPDNPAAYAGLNMTSFEEIDWSVNYNVQAGIWIRPENKDISVRIGVEYYHGHSPLTQFFREREQYVSFGVWIHL